MDFVKSPRAWRRRWRRAGRGSEGLAWSTPNLTAPSHHTTSPGLHGLKRWLERLRPTTRAGAYHQTGTGEDNGDAPQRQVMDAGVVAAQGRARIRAGSRFLRRVRRAAVQSGSSRSSGVARGGGRLLVPAVERQARSGNVAQGGHVARVSLSGISSPHLSLAQGRTSRGTLVQALRRAGRRVLGPAVIPWRISSRGGRAQNDAVTSLSASTARWCGLGARTKAGRKGRLRWRSETVPPSRAGQGTPPARRAQRSRQVEEGGHGRAPGRRRPQRRRAACRARSRARGFDLAPVTAAGSCATREAWGPRAARRARRGPSGPGEEGAPRLGE